LTYVDYFFLRFILAVQHLRTIISLIFTNSEVRKLLADFSVIGRDLLSQGLVKVSGAIAPTKDELSEVDKAGPEGEFVTEGGSKVGTRETPVVEAKVPGTEKQIVHEPTEGATVVRGEGEPGRDVGELAQTTREQKDRVKEGVLGQSRTEDVDRGRVEGATKDVVGDERLERAKQSAEETMQRAMENGEREAREREMAPPDEKAAHAQRKIGGIMGRFKGAKVKSLSNAYSQVC